MALKLFETSLNHVPAELQSYYAKQPDGCYALNVSDLDAHVAPLKSAIAKMKLDSALKNADVRPQHADLLLRRLSDRLAIDTKDGESTVRVLPANSEMLLASDGEPDGATTLDELVAATAKQFPFLFGKEPIAPSDRMPDASDKTITESQFRSLSPLEQRKKIVDEGYRVIDDPKAPKRQPRPGVKEMSRDDFGALTPIERARKMSDGWTLFE